MDFIKKLTELGQQQENRQKLLLELSDREIRMDIYHNGELSSRQLHLQQSMQQNGAEAYASELARMLCSEMLWKLEEKAELVFFLPEEWCYVDRLVLPQLEGRELQRTIEWELEQAVPWPRNNYSYDSLLVDAEANTYLVAAAPLMLVDKLLNIGKELELAVICITTVATIDGYLAKKPCVNLLPLRNKRRLSYPGEKRLAEIIVAVAATVALGAAGLSYGWSWWTETNLHKLEGELSAMAVWNQRMDITDSLERRLKHIQHIVVQLNKNKQPIFPQLELWGSSVGDECWLERIEMKHGSNELLLMGKSTNADAASEFIKRLSECGYYKKVELVELRDGSLKQGYSSFNIRVLPKEVQQ